MRWIALAALIGCNHAAPSAGEIADRGWRAHEIVVTAGEHAPTCPEAAAAMQRAIAEHRQDFLDAYALDQDPDRLRAATDYLEAHADRYADLEPRMEALSEKCHADAGVQLAFREMKTP